MIYGLTHKGSTLWMGLFLFNVVTRIRHRRMYEVTLSHGIEPGSPGPKLNALHINKAIASSLDAHVAANHVVNQSSMMVRTVRLDQDKSGKSLRW